MTNFEPTPDDLAMSSELKVISICFNKEYDLMHYRYNGWNNSATSLLNEPCFKDVYHVFFLVDRKKRKVATGLFAKPEVQQGMREVIERGSVASGALEVEAFLYHPQIKPPPPIEIRNHPEKLNGELEKFLTGSENLPCGPLTIVFREHRLNDPLTSRF